MTGGRGRLGRLLVEDLRAAGPEVVSLGRSRHDADHPDDVVVDLRDSDAVADITRRSAPEVIVHLASVLRGGELAADNRLIDSAVAGAAREARTRRIVHISSGAVYGTSATEARREDSALEGDGPYAKSKIAGEELFRTLADDRPETAVMTLRVFNVAGPAFPDSLVHKLMHATSAEPVTVVAPDRFVRDYIHQSDVLAVLRAAVGAEHAGHRVLNVGAGAAISTRMLLAGLQIDDARVVEKDGGPSFNWADISLLLETLGVVPGQGPTRDWESATRAD
ncbi:NAD-dependent epimerase/dehydratase family protein [Agromyces lapidis]|uniref:NAD-dependent epimerase/dehydratase family protein n=1 Tax=Agromyces lapidis TaxID=279574 RepID=A0ABV5ST41_9MICO|nr:SDR family oxidoreductase [Agromyces lapidis]